jgi:ankyrin repeat protein
VKTDQSQHRSEALRKMAGRQNLPLLAAALTAAGALTIYFYAIRPDSISHTVERTEGFDVVKSVETSVPNENAQAVHQPPQQDTTVSPPPPPPQVQSVGNEANEVKEPTGSQNQPDLRKRASKFAPEKLHLAVENRDVKQALMLIKNGADVDGCLDGESPLFVASRDGSVDIIPILLQGGADVNLRRNDGATPFIIAIQEGHEQVIRLLLSAGAEVNPMKRLQTSNPLVDVSSSRVAVKQNDEGSDDDVDNNNNNSDGADDDDDDDDDDFHIGKEGSVHEERESDFSEETPTPLLIAAANGHANIVEMLLDYGSNIDDCDDTGATALWMASQDNHIEVVKVLVKNKCDINATMNGGETPLIIASHRGHVDTVSFLLKNGARVNHLTSDGMGALFAASHQGHQECVALLLKYGADKSVEYVGFTPFKIAEAQGHQNIMSLLA